MKRVAPILLIAIAATLLCTLTACSSLPDATTDEPLDEGLFVAGIITAADGTGLGGVTVSSAEQTLAVSDDNGVFSATGLSQGDTIIFDKDGYSLSPSSFTVTRSVNDLRITAVAVNPDDNPPDEDDDNETNPPDEDDGDGDTQPPVEPTPLPAPDNAGVVYVDSTVAFFVTVHESVQTVSFSFACKDGTVLSASAPVAEGTLDFAGINAPLTLERDGDECLLSLDITAFLHNETHTFDITVTASAEGFISSEVSATLTFAMNEPAVGTPRYSDGILTWSACKLPEGATFAVMRNGVPVVACRDTVIDLAALGIVTDGRTSIRVAAASGGSIVMVSDEIIL